MPLSRQDAIEITRYLEDLIRLYDPAAFELILRAADQDDNPEQNLITLLRTLSSFYRERSGSEQGQVLDRLNHYVRLASGEPIRGISVVLSPAERERYGREEIDLAVLPDRTDFLREIDAILRTLESEFRLRGQQ